MSAVQSSVRRTVFEDAFLPGVIGGNQYLFTVGILPETVQDSGLLPRDDIHVFSQREYAPFHEFDRDIFTLKSVGRKKSCTGKDFPVGVVELRRFENKIIFIGKFRIFSVGKF